MGLGDFADEAKDAASNNEQVQQYGEQGLDKARDAANDATGDKFLGSGRPGSRRCVGRTRLR